MLVSITVYRTSLSAADDAQIGMGCLFEFDSKMLLSEVLNIILIHKSFSVLQSKASDWPEIWHFSKESKVLATINSIDNTIEFNILVDDLAGNIFDDGDKLNIIRDVDIMKKQREILEKKKAQARIDKAIARNKRR